MKMSLTRVMAELKMTDKKIKKHLREDRFVGMEIGDRGIVGYSSVEDFKREITGNYDRIKQLLKNRNILKAALVKANAETYVTIGEKTMTLAEAIEKRNTVNFDREFLAALSGQYSKVVHDVTYENKIVEQRLDTLIEANLGKDAKTKTEDSKDFMEMFTKKNNAKIVDSINIANTIAELEEEVDLFEREIDFVLSEINAKTEVEIELV